MGKRFHALLFSTLWAHTAFSWHAGPEVFVPVARDDGINSRVIERQLTLLYAFDVVLILIESIRDLVLDATFH